MKTELLENLIRVCAREVLKQVNNNKITPASKKTITNEQFKKVIKKIVNEILDTK